MVHATSHTEQIVFLRKIEGQIRGIQKMIEDGRYCVDILTQLGSVVGALLRVEDEILARHLQHCVREALKKGPALEQKEKIDEVINLLKRFRKSS